MFLLTCNKGLSFSLVTLLLCIYKNTSFTVIKGTAYVESRVFQSNLKAFSGHNRKHSRPGPWEACLYCCMEVMQRVLGHKHRVQPPLLPHCTPLAVALVTAGPALRRRASPRLLCLAAGLPPGQGSPLPEPVGVAWSRLGLTSAATAPPSLMSQGYNAASLPADKTRAVHTQSSQPLRRGGGQMCWASARGFKRHREEFCSRV